MKWWNIWYQREVVFGSELKHFAIVKPPGRARREWCADFERPAGIRWHETINTAFPTKLYPNSSSVPVKRTLIDLWR
jgi:hypothetical protein